MSFFILQEGSLQDRQKLKKKLTDLDLTRRKRYLESSTRNLTSSRKSLGSLKESESLKLTSKSLINGPHGQMYMYELGTSNKEKRKPLASRLGLTKDDSQEEFSKPHRRTHSSASSRASDNSSSLASVSCEPIGKVSGPQKPELTRVYSNVSSIFSIRDGESALLGEAKSAQARTPPSEHLDTK